MKFLKEMFFDEGFTSSSHIRFLKIKDSEVLKSLTKNKKNLQKNKKMFILFKNQ